MKMSIEIPDEVLVLLQTGKAIEGTIKMDLMTCGIRFNAFRRKSRERGYVRPSDVTLAESVSGWLKRSVKKNKIFVSVNRSMGNVRSASELMLQAKELTDCLRHMMMTVEISEEEML
jgi:hypothetical protein